MFTGIIENTGIIQEIKQSGTNLSFIVNSAISRELKIDQSLSHNGVCLTVEEIDGEHYKVTAIEETIQKTNAGEWKVGKLINLERCLQLNGRLDGHIVQGHVDTVAICTKLIDKEGSWEYSFELDPSFSTCFIEKGSISLNGISLTIFNVTETGFTVAIIPYTYNHTNMQQLQPGESVNIEFDMIGKYVNRIAQFQKP